MQVVILAAGRGKRLRPLTDKTPKPLLKIAGRPILDLTLNQLPLETEEILIVVDYLKEQIKEYLGEEFKGRKITYVEQKKRLGTAHALSICKDYIRDEKVLVLNGDDLYSKKDIVSCLKHSLAMLVKRVDDTRRFGVVEIDGKGFLKNISEQTKAPFGGLVNMGVYVLDKRFFSYPMIRLHDGEFGLPQTISSMAKDHPVKTVKAKFWHPIAYPEDIKKATDSLSGVDPVVDF